MVRLFRALYEFPKATIAAVNGAAIAGGTGLALLCDFTLAVPEAKFGYTEVRIGFVPAIVSTFLLRQVGEKQARDLLLTGRLFGRGRSLRLGLINEIVPPEKLMTRARELAAQLMENSPASLRATKQLLTEHARAELDAQIEAAVRENAAIRNTADFREGITSFLEKRKPAWTAEMSLQHAINHRGDRNPAARALCRDRPDGRGLSRQSFDLVRGGPRRTHAADGIFLSRHGAR